MAGRGRVRRKVCMHQMVEVLTKALSSRLSLYVCVCGERGVGMCVYL